MLKREDEVVKRGTKSQLVTRLERTCDLPSLGVGRVDPETQVSEYPSTFHSPSPFFCALPSFLDTGYAVILCIKEMIIHTI